MAVICEHCNTVVKPGEVAVLEGFSYHDSCQKCYICSETNLKNAEIFRGVIFCSTCSKRIFQGCSSARRVKTKSRKRRGTRRRRNDNNRIIELARLNCVNSDSSRSKSSDVMPIDNTVIKNEPKSFELKKNSIDTATTTDVRVTQELLKHIFYSVDNKVGKFTSPVKPRKKCKILRGVKNKKELCSDLRIAELGKSTEIAHMALRRQSEQPVIIKSDSRLRRLQSKSLSYISQESNSSGDGDQDSSYYSQDLVKKHWMDRRIRSIIKLPYRSFKRNILERSSIINAIMDSDASADCILRRIKMLFREETTEHQRRGLRRLFSTINRKKIPFKLGWLEIMDRIPEDARLNDHLAKREDKRCRHFRTSHSYRCMRTQAMKLAGPTKSELVVLRTKLKNLLCYDFFKQLLGFNKQLINLMTTQACK